MTQNAIAPWIGHPENPNTQYGQQVHSSVMGNIGDIQRLAGTQSINPADAAGGGASTAAMADSTGGTY